MLVLLLFDQYMIFIIHAFTVIHIVIYMLTYAISYPLLFIYIDQIHGAICNAASLPARVLLPQQSARRLGYSVSELCTGRCSGRR